MPPAIRLKIGVALLLSEESRSRESSKQGVANFSSQIVTIRFDYPLSAPVSKGRCKVD